MSLAIPSDGRGRSGSGETQARPKATAPMIGKQALVHYQNEKSFIWRKVAGATMKGKAMGSDLKSHFEFSLTLSMQAEL